MIDENEYKIAQNKAIANILYQVCRGLLPGEEYHVSEEKYVALKSMIMDIQSNLHGLPEIKEKTK